MSLAHLTKLRYSSNQRIRRMMILIADIKMAARELFPFPDTLIGELKHGVFQRKLTAHIQ